VGKLRPAGGGKSKRDRDLRDTILREIKEEFGIPEKVTAKKIKLLGYINDGEFKDCAVFEMQGHGLTPGKYQASNSKNEFVNLVESTLDDPLYIGPKPAELRKFKDKKHPGNDDSKIKEACEWIDYHVKSGSFAEHSEDGDPFDLDVLRTLGMFLNVNFSAGLDLDGTSREIKEDIRQFLETEDSVNHDVLAASKEKIANYVSHAV